MGRKEGEILRGNWRKKLTRGNISGKLRCPPNHGMGQKLATEAGEAEIITVTGAILRQGDLDLVCPGVDAVQAHQDGISRGQLDGGRGRHKELQQNIRQHEAVAVGRFIQHQGF